MSVSEDVGILAWKDIKNKLIINIDFGGYMKRIITGVLLIAIVFTFAYAEPNKPSDWAKNDIENLAKLKFLDERMEGRYQTPITRADFAYLSVVIYEVLTGKKASVGEASFPDTTDPYVLKAKNLGIVNGYPSGDFAPNNYISRQEIAKLFVLSLQKASIELNYDKNFVFEDDADIMTWAKEYVYLAHAENIINGVEKNIFDPDAYATREQAQIIFKRIIDRYMDKEELRRPINQTKGLNIGDLAPDFEVKTMDEKSLSLSDYSGQAVLMLFITPNFSICEEQLEIITELEKDYKNINFLVFDIANNQAEEKKEQSALPILFGDKKLIELYKIDSVPMTVIIDSSGKIVYYGSGKISNEALSELLKDL